MSGHNPADSIVLTDPGWPRPRCLDTHGISRPTPWITQAPEFAVMDPTRGRESIEQRLCQVCGEGFESGGDVVIFLDGPLRSAESGRELEDFEHRGARALAEVRLKAIDQALLHERCAQLAAGACPQLRRMRAENRLFAFVGPVDAVEHETRDGVPTTVFMAGEAAKPWPLPEQSEKWATA